MASNGTDRAAPGVKVRRGPHKVAIIEQEAPGVFEIRCRCGAVTSTHWGAAHANELATNHLYKARRLG